MSNLKDRIEQIGHDRIPARFDNTKDRIAYLLAEYKLGGYLAALALIGFIGTGRLSVDVPDPIRLGLIGMAVGIIPAVFVGFRLIDRWLPDPRIKVLLFDPDGPRIDPIRIPRQLWQRREVIDMPVWAIDKGETDAIVTDLDYIDATDTLKIRGVNPELADPVSMVARDERLSKTYGDLIETVRELKAQEMTEAARQVEVEESVIDDLIATVEQGALFSDGEFSDGDLFTPDPTTDPKRETMDDLDRDLNPRHDHDPQD